jgi:hypothetical protein
MESECYQGVIVSNAQHRDDPTICIASLHFDDGGGVMVDDIPCDEVAVGRRLEVCWHEEA